MVSTVEPEMEKE
jgi:hypothetical protein